MKRSRFVEEAHQRVRKILSERRAVLDDLAHLLSRKESVQGEELRSLAAATPASLKMLITAVKAWIKYDLTDRR
jgi:ATP-dependent Zn protease